MSSLLLINTQITHSVPGGAQGHVLQGWFLDWFDSIVVLVELSGYFVLANHYSTGICTNWYGMGLYHYSLQARRWIRLTSAS